MDEKLLENDEEALEEQSLLNLQEQEEEVEEEKETTKKSYSNTYDRDNSWIGFNLRVLAQCRRTDFPLKFASTFIGIAESNLEEFIAVRFSERYFYYKHKLIAKKLYWETLGLIQSCREAINQEACRVLNTEYDPVMIREKALKFYEKTLSIILMPIQVDRRKEIPYLHAGDINFLVKTVDENNKKAMFLLQIPSMIGRYLEKDERMILFDDIVAAFLPNKFEGMTIKNFISFRVIKNCGDIHVDIGSKETVVDDVNRILQWREENNIVFIDVCCYNDNLDENYKITKYLLKLFHISEYHTSLYKRSSGEILNPGFLKNGIKRTLLKGDIVSVDDFKKLNPVIPEDLSEADSIMNYLEDEKDLLLHHPYESYDPVLKFISQAANDPLVISIRQTLYRVSPHKSKVIKALCDASKNGKVVAVVLELMARFDEKQNVSLITTLKEAGVNIMYSPADLKTHCKMCVVTRYKGGKTQIFSHIGTGNYNESTAKVYTDISYLTSRGSVGRDLIKIFDWISGCQAPKGLEMVYYSPVTMREFLIQKIQSLITDPNKNVTIKIKVNAIADSEVIRTIESVAKKHANVQFRIICRSACGLHASENIFIHSIVGRFLEHSRIYCFCTDDEREIYIASADLLTRNLSRRIESMVRVNGTKASTRVEEIFDTYWKDEANTWIMGPDGNYQPLEESTFNAQKEFMG